MELDDKGRYKADVARQLQILKGASINSGIELFNKELYKKALNAFDIANTLSADMGVMDTAIVYNAALAAEKAEMYDVAIDNYRKCIETGYNGGDVYYTLVGIYKIQENMDAAKQAIDEGLAKYPGHSGLLGEQVNISLGSGDSSGAKDGVLKMIENDPNNANLRFVLGNTLDKEGDKVGAIAAYQKALELKPGYFDAIYNIGAIYFNDAVEANKVCNEIPPKEFKKYDACRESVIEDFKKAKPYFEQAHDLNNEDQGTISSLMQIYGQLGETEKQVEMKNLLGQ